MNNSTIDINYPTHIPQSFQMVKIVLLSLILAACLFGNILVVIAISRTNSLRNSSNLLVINLSLCDITTAVCGIPFTLIIFNIHYNSQYYPYGEIGCKLLWPITTYASNCSAFTLATIAVERYINISSISVGFSRKRSAVAIAIIHALAFIVVIPYSVNLKYLINDNGAFCYERWSDQWHAKVYTISLFIIQYALPLNLMAIFYLLAWRKVYINNRTVIRMSEEYEMRVNWKERYSEKLDTDSISNTIPQETLNVSSTSSHKMKQDRTTSREGDEYPTSSTIKRILKKRKRLRNIAQKSLAYNKSRRKNKRNFKSEETVDSLLCSSGNHSIITIQGETYLRNTSTYSSSCDTESLGRGLRKQDRKRFNKSRYASETSYIRHRQSVKTLKMFTVVVIVFACFALPNQLTWLLQDFSHLPPIASYIFILFTYVSSVVNCWIYGGFNYGIRKAYMKTICCSCYGMIFRNNTTTRRTKSSPHNMNSRQDELVHQRTILFNNMFKQYTANFERTINTMEHSENTNMISND